MNGRGTLKRMRSGRTAAGAAICAVVVSLGWLGLSHAEEEADFEVAPAKEAAPGEHQSSEGAAGEAAPGGESDSSNAGKETQAEGEKVKGGWSGFEVRGDADLDALRMEIYKLELQVKARKLRRELDDLSGRPRKAKEEAAKAEKPAEPPPKVQLAGMDPTGTRIRVNGKLYTFRKVGETVGGVTLIDAGGGSATIRVGPHTVKAQ